MIVKATAIGIVMKNAHEVAIVVDRRYRPCAPTIAQHTIPIDIVTFPKATKGNNSTSMDWIVASGVSNGGKRSARPMKAADAEPVTMAARSIDL
jgi:hypothetical protein